MSICNSLAISKPSRLHRWVVVVLLVFLNACAGDSAAAHADELLLAREISRGPSCKDCTGPRWVDNTTLLLNQVTEEVTGSDQMGSIYRERMLLWDLAAQEYKEIFSGHAYCATPEWVQISTPARPRGSQRYFEGPPRGPYVEVSTEVFNTTRTDIDCRRKAKAPEVVHEHLVSRLRDGFGYLDFGPQPKLSLLTVYQPGSVVQVREANGTVKEVQIFPEWVRPDGTRFIVNKINSRWTMAYVRFLDAYLIHGQLGGRTGQVPTTPPYYYLFHRDGRAEERQGPVAPWHTSKITGFEPKLAMTKRGAIWSAVSLKDQYNYLDDGYQVKRTDFGMNISPNGCMSAGMDHENPRDVGAFGFVRKGAVTRPIVKSICE